MRIYEIAPLSLSSTLSGVLRSFTSHLGTNNRLHYVPFCTRRNANGSPLYCSLVKFATLDFFEHVDDCGRTDPQDTDDIPHTTAIECHVDDLLFHGRQPPFVAVL